MKGPRGNQAESAPVVWRVAAASVRGASHVRLEQPCQDAHAFALLPNGALVAAVADGAGSAALSEVGSAMAAEAAVAAIATAEQLPQATDAQGWQALLTDALRLALLRLEAEAEKRKIDLSALATTLLLAVATPELTAVIQVGDGAIVVGDADSTARALTFPLHGEYANTTVFLTSPDALPTAQFGLHPAATYLALFSDGLQRIALDMATGAPFAPFFLPLFRFVAQEADAAAAEVQLTAFLSSPRVQERSDDDITLALAARLPL
jgi:hypothetical protein